MNSLDLLFLVLGFYVRFRFRAGFWLKKTTTHLKIIVAGSEDSPKIIRVGYS